MGNEMFKIALYEVLRLNNVSPVFCSGIWCPKESIGHIAVKKLKEKPNFDAACDIYYIT
jgi:hypothetical protein